MPHVPGHVEPQQPAMAGQSFLDRLGDLFADVLNQTNQGMQQNIDPIILNRQKIDYQQALRALATLMQSDFFENLGESAMQGLQVQGQGMQALGNMPQQIMPTTPKPATAPAMNPQAVASFAQRSTPPKMPMQQIPPGY
jgi:hypothetical protein